MNAEFYNCLNKSKTLENASQVEKIKDIYLMSEKVAQLESAGKTDDRAEAFFPNGSVRCTRFSDGIFVEASATGTRNMYGTVGIISSGNLKEALAAGKSALDNDAVMESMFGQFTRNAEKTPEAV